MGYKQEERGPENRPKRFSQAAEILDSAIESYEEAMELFDGEDQKRCAGPRLPPLPPCSRPRQGAARSVSFCSPRALGRCLRRHSDTRNCRLKIAEHAATLDTPDDYLKSIKMYETVSQHMRMWPGPRPASGTASRPVCHMCTGDLCDCGAANGSGHPLPPH